MLAELEIRCATCRDGMVEAPEWSAWYARADEVEGAHLAEHGNIDGLYDCDDWQLLVDERPGTPEEIECNSCAGTGVRLTDAGREVLAWAQRRLTAA